MSEEAKRRTLERLDKEIDQKEKTLVGLKADVLSRQKLLESLNSVDKSSNGSLAQALKRHEDEILVRDKQIANLYQRIEELQKGETPKDTTTKQQPPQANVEELTQAWEAQKVKYVEEIQNLTIELKKKNRHIEEKCKGYEDTIKTLEIKITDHGKKENNYIEEIVTLKNALEKLEKEKDEDKKHYNDRINALNNENETLGNINQQLRGSLENREGSLRKMESTVLDSEKSQRDLREKENTILELQQEISGLKLENENLNNNYNRLLSAQAEKDQSQTDMQLNIETLADKISSLTEDLDKEKEEAKKAQNDLKTEQSKVKELTQSLEQHKKQFEASNQAFEQTKKEKEGLLVQVRKVEELAAEKEKLVAQVRKAEELAVEKEKLLAQTQKALEAQAHKDAADAKVKSQQELESVQASLLEEKQQLQSEVDKLKKEKSTISTSFEDKLQVIKEENDREIAKLNNLLQTTEAEKNDKVHALQEKQQKLKELEKMNSTFEALVQGLKTTILEVQERLDKNSRYISDLQKRLEAKEAELALTNPQQSLERENEINRLKQMLENKDAEAARLEKSLLQMIDEANMFKQKYKNASEKLIVMNKGQSKYQTKQISDKDTEIDILKEMLKSSQGVIRTKDLEIQRLKQKYKEDSSLSPLKLPGLPSEPMYRKESNKAMFPKIGPKFSADSDVNMILNEFKEREREMIAKKEKQLNSPDRETTTIEDMTNHLQEIAKIKQMAEGMEIPYDKPSMLPELNTKFNRNYDRKDSQGQLELSSEMDLKNKMSPVKVSKRKPGKKGDESDDE